MPGQKFFCSGLRPHHDWLIIWATVADYLKCGAVLMLGAGGSLWRWRWGGGRWRWRRGALGCWRWDAGAAAAVLALAGVMASWSWRVGCSAGAQTLWQWSWALSTGAGTGAGANARAGAGVVASVAIAQFRRLRFRGFNVCNWGSRLLWSGILTSHIQQEKDFPTDFLFAFAPEGQNEWNHFTKGEMPDQK